MRIAHVTDFYLPRLGGIEMHVRDLAMRQQAAGHEVEVITSSPRPAGERTPERPGDGAGGLRVHRLTETVPFSSWLHPAGLWAGHRMLRKGGYDVVHAHAGPFSPLAFAAAAGAAHVPTVVTVHSLISYLEPAFRALDTGVNWSAWPAVWTAVSDAAAEPLRRLVGPAPVLVLPNGIDASAWRVDPLPREPDEVLVVAVMRLAARKRPVHLLRMLRAAQAAMPPSTRIRAVIVGEGPKRPVLERYLRRHAMTRWVSMPGRLPRSEIRSLFARADLFVAPAILESFGIAALEARCAGLPVVARAEGGIGEFVSDGEEGILADSDSAMTEAIIRLATDAAERHAIAARNRAVPPTVAWPDVVDLTTEMYELAIDRLRPPLKRGLFGMAG
ncbi:MAG: GDP-mannose-dependent alpha-(1-2)-phosphatidylinositol mannosyltransferase [Actinomycetia bacterium]|nr:GDP-mannose-dependent alpha-(1-2)-phosphatidylinositol mannosyltransferase [Actinomycetes bacterium]